MIQLTEVEHAALLADAMRYRGLRAIATEPDDAMSDRFVEALEALPNDDPPNPAAFDAYADAAIAACDAVRRCA